MRDIKPRTFGRRLLGGLSALCGWLTVYIAVGGLAGFFVAENFPDGNFGETSCWPFYGKWGGIVTRCPTSAVDWFWFATVGIPRAAIMLPALGILMLLLLPFAAPTLIVVWAGARYWWRRARVIAIVAPLAVIVEIAAIVAAPSLGYLL